MLKSEKLKKELEKNRLEEYKAKRDEKRAAAELNIQHKKQELREKTNYLKSKDKQKGKLITEIKEALKEDIDQKKEISLLKKKDQMENFERGKNFHQLYKQKLVERILEKKERAERVKEQQQRIANMCGTQRVRVNRAFSQTETHMPTK